MTRSEARGLGFAEAAGPLQHSGDLGDVQHGMAAVARRRQPPPGAAVMVAAMVDEHHHVLHRQARALQLADALQDAAACDQDVVYHHHPVALLKVALDQAPGAMGLHLLAGIDQRLVQLQ